MSRKKQNMICLLEHGPERPVQSPHVLENSQNRSVHVWHALPRVVPAEYGTEFVEGKRGAFPAKIRRLILSFRESYGP
jgi:hypothetical protein